MPANTKPVKVEPAALPVAPTWEELKANPQFLEWHKSPFLRLMTASLRVSTPVSIAMDPHSMIRDAGITQGYLTGLLAIDDFCKINDTTTDKPKKVAYAAGQQHQQD